MSDEQPPPRTEFERMMNQLGTLLVDQRQAEQQAQQETEDTDNQQ